MNRKILISGFSIFSALALMGGSAFALFSSQATSQNNTFATGNADLQIAEDILPGDPDIYGSNIPAPAVDQAGIFPGFTQGYKFWLKNNSTSTISLDLNTTFDDVVIIGGSPTLADELTAQFTCVSDTDSNGSFDTTIATTGTSSINGWDAGSSAMGTLGPNDATSDGQGADETLCTMTVSLPGSSTDTVAGASLRFDGVFNGTQTP